MARSVEIGEAETILPQLVKDSVAGEDIILSQDGKALVRFVPILTQAPDKKLINRNLGFAAKYLTDFSWEEWEKSHEEFRKLFRNYQDFK
jgi:antitoxin (DNA-binding transcriptional repressor) of toxin-antitoxin stability system